MSRDVSTNGLRKKEETKTKKKKLIAKLCIPNGDAWQTVNPKYVNPVTDPKSCGMPCQDQHHKTKCSNDDDDDDDDDEYIPSNRV